MRLPKIKFLFDGGEIVECGFHEELMAQNGKYAQMYHVQAKKYAILGEIPPSNVCSTQAAINDKK